MTDETPDVEAAQRAWDDTDGFGFNTSRDAMEESARQALAPIRARHQPQTACANILHEWVECGGCETRCRHCGDQWPCDDARDSWTSEELGNA